MESKICKETEKVFDYRYIKMTINMLYVVVFMGIVLAILNRSESSHVIFIVWSAIFALSVILGFVNKVKRCDL